MVESRPAVLGSLVVIRGSVSLWGLAQPAPHQHTQLEALTELSGAWTSPGVIPTPRCGRAESRP